METYLLSNFFLFLFFWYVFRCLVQHKTIDSVLARGEKLDSLVEKSSDLSTASQVPVHKLHHYFYILPASCIGLHVCFYFDVSLCFLIALKMHSAWFWWSDFFALLVYCHCMQVFFIIWQLAEGLINIRSSYEAQDSGHWAIAIKIWVKLKVL